MPPQFALPLVRDLLLRAKDLFVGAKRGRACALLVRLRPLQAEFLKFGAKVHEGGGWYQPFEQVERVK